LPRTPAAVPDVPATPALPVDVPVTPTPPSASPSMAPPLRFSTTRAGTTPVPFRATFVVASEVLFAFHAGLLSLPRIRLEPSGIDHLRAAPSPRSAARTSYSRAPRP